MSDLPPRYAEIRDLLTPDRALFQKTSGPSALRGALQRELSSCQLSDTPYGEISLKLHKSPDGKHILILSCDGAPEDWGRALESLDGSLNEIVSVASKFDLLLHDTRNHVRSIRISEVETACHLSQRVLQRARRIWFLSESPLSPSPFASFFLTKLLGMDAASKVYFTRDRTELSSVYGDMGTVLGVGCPKDAFWMEVVPEGSSPSPISLKDTVKDGAVKESSKESSIESSKEGAIQQATMNHGFIMKTRLGAIDKAKVVQHLYSPASSLVPLEAAYMEENLFLGEAVLDRIQERISCAEMEEAPQSPDEGSFPLLVEALSALDGLHHTTSDLLAKKDVDDLASKEGELKDIDSLNDKYRESMEQTIGTYSDKLWHRH